MKTKLNLTIVTLLLAVSNLSADTHYVSLASTSPTPPYTNWVTAATNIQDAVSVASAGDGIIVANGIYPGGLNVSNALALRSVNGPQFTSIDGGGTKRCVMLLTNGASLTGFTLTNGMIRGSSPSQYGATNHSCGGGAYCASTNVFLTNCVITGNHAAGLAIPYWLWVGWGAESMEARFTAVCSTETWQPAPGA